MTSWFFDVNRSIAIDTPKRSLRFTPAMRLRQGAAFDAVRTAKMRKNAGPLSALTRPNELPHHRLGLVVARRVGTAVRRNRIKRLLRESFRLMERDIDVSYDLVIIVHPHEPMQLVDYQKLLATLLSASHQDWHRRSQRRARSSSSSTDKPAAPTTDGNDTSTGESAGSPS